MFGKVFTFELRYQLRNPVFWVVAVVYFLLSFGWATVDQIRIGDLGPNDHKNGPFAITQVYLIWTIFFMFVTTAFVANVVVRDYETGFGPIVHTTRVSKFDYLIGRFAGAYTAGALVFLASPIAMIIGSAMPWLDADGLGPFQPWFYLQPYLVIVLPGLLLTSTAFFALATATRSMMATYLGVVVFLLAYFVASTWANKPEYEKIAALLEPFGDAAYSLVTKYWTATERNTLVSGVSGLLLWNRLWVLAASGGFLALAYGLFHSDERSQPARGKVKAAAPERPRPAVSDMIHPERRFDAAAVLAQLVARSRLDMGQVFLSPAFIVLMALGLINAAASLWMLDQTYGTDIYPVTRMMIEVLDGAFTIFPIIVAIFYAGDLVWRDRDRGAHEMIESTPAPDWTFVAPKTIAITLVLACSLLVSVLTAMVIQAIRGFPHFEVGKYLVWYVLPNTVDCFLITALAVFLQAISPHKFVGWGLMVLYVVLFLFVGPNLGLQHHLYRYGISPGIPLSDMNGQGRFWIGAWWFRLYWSAFAIILLVLANALWRRGVEIRLLPRLKRLPHRLMGPAGIVAAVALVVFVGSGVWIFVNTNVWNHYRSLQDEDRWLADYEKTLLPYETTPQPKIVNVHLDVDIRPRRPSVVTRGVYLLENRTSAPLREIHVRFPRDLVMRSLSIEGARPKITYDRFNYRIFTFDTPMAPGERRTMAFETVLKEQGFKNARDLTSVVRNGTFLHDRDIAPTLGMDRQNLLSDRRKRAKYGLPRELRTAALGAPGADQFNGVGHDADWVTADIWVATDADQTPIAPGYKVLDRIQGDRRVSEFVTEAPILRYFSIQSARYAQRSETYKGVNLTVFYDPQHPWNVGRMIGAMKASLDYDQANFSPYQFRQLRFLEFPAWNGNFAESFANTVPWSEDLGFIADLPKRSDKIDYVTYVGAHEIAHQWWGHQVVGADEQGGEALIETLAQYSALMVMKHMYGPDMIRRFLKYELDRYLRARGGDVLPEQPLERVENQPYIYYRKGSLVMYRLQEEIGEDAVNRALGSLINAHAFKGPPYPTTLELIAALRAQAPQDKQALITDLFEKITLYDVKTTRATVRKRPDSRYDVTLTVSARKLYADGAGKETDAPMAETLDVGLFTSDPAKPGFDASKVIDLQRLPIRSGVQTLHLVSAKAPRFAGVDPYDKLIDRDADDNVVRVGG